MGIGFVLACGREDSWRSNRRGVRGGIGVTLAAQGQASGIVRRSGVGAVSGVCGFKYFARVGSVFFADEDFEARARPRKVIAHAADGVRLDHGFDASFSEGGDG